MFKRYIGDRAFYRRVLSFVIPILIQNGITNLVSLLDNIMVGAVGSLPMSGVSIANQLMFVFNLSIFGANAGAGIFCAQFHGSGDIEKVRQSFRFKLLASTILTAAGLAIFMTLKTPLINLYLQGEGDPADAAATLGYSLDYLHVMLWGLLPFALTNVYATTLRETGKTFVPMLAGVVAVFVNLVLNYILIFGHFGAPAMGVQGAAMATVISRFVELGIVAVWTHMHSTENPYIRGAFRSFYISGQLTGNILRKGTPLLINEFLWGSGTAMLMQCYSTCGLDVVPALNISSTIMNLANVAFMAVGQAVGVLMGQMLGAGKTEKEIRDTHAKLMVIAVTSAVVCGGLAASISGLFPMIYNTTDSVRSLATSMILITCAMMPIGSYTFATYFTLRSGGQTWITFLFDGCFIWVCSVATAFVLTRFTGLPILAIYAIIQSLDILRFSLGLYLLRKGTWMRNLTQ